MTRFKKLALVSALNLAVFAPASNAALVTEILGLDIAGTLYDVTFNADSSFNSLWDGDNNQTFGSDGSAFDTAPTFWGSSTDAQVAASAIAVALGSVNYITTLSNGDFSDAFLVPYAFFDVAADPVKVLSMTDYDSSPGTEGTIGQGSLSVAVAGASLYASFTPTVVPVPAAVWLFGSGLIALIGLARRKVRA